MERYEEVWGGREMNGEVQGGMRRFVLRGIGRYGDVQEVQGG